MLATQLYNPEQVKLDRFHSVLLLANDAVGADTSPASRYCTEIGSELLPTSVAGNVCVDGFVWDSI